jgi:hypothetical protein
MALCCVATVYRTGRLDRILPLVHYVPSARWQNPHLPSGSGPPSALLALVRTITAAAGVSRHRYYRTISLAACVCSASVLARHADIDGSQSLPPGIPHRDFHITSCFCMDMVVVLVLQMSNWRCTLNVF